MSLLKRSLLAALALATLPAQAQTTCPTDSNKVRLMAVGDIIFHGALLQQAMNENKGGFEALWQPVLPLMKQANLLYGNLEGPAAEKVNERGQFVASAPTGYDPAGDIYSPGTEGKSYTFNFHPDGVRALEKSGFHVFSLANNHSADRRSLGIDKTLELFDNLQIQTYGTRHSQRNTPWSVVLQKNNIRLGFVGCTYGTNGGGAASQIMQCYQQGKPNSVLINEIAALSQKVDLVVFTPHWGNEYAFSASAAQKSLADAALKAGARLILGSHPHVLQPVEVRRSSTGKVDSIIAYSLGNWVTNQQPYDYRDQAKHMKFFSQRISNMLFLEIEKTNAGIEMQLPKLVPTYMAAKHETSFGGRALYPAYPELYEKQKTLQQKIKTAQHYLEVGNPFNVSPDLKKDHYQEVRRSFLQYKVPVEKISSLFCEVK